MRPEPEPWTTSRGTIVVAGILSLGAGYLAIRNAADQALARTAPERAAHFAPASGTALAGLALNHTTANDGMVDAVGRNLLRRSLRLAPLLATPLVVAGLDASAGNDEPKARALFREAERRDPRSVIARYWLFDDAMQRGDYASGLAEAGPLMALQPLSRDPMITYLTALLTVPQAKRALIGELRREPSWRNTFVQEAASSPSRIAALQELMTLAPSQRPGEARDEQRMVIQGLAAQGDFAGAYRLWQESLPAGKAPAVVGIYNGTFAALPGVPPFNWRYPSARLGVGVPVQNAQAADQTGLQIHFSGDSPAVLARQTVVVPVGRYTLNYQLQTMKPLSADAPAIEARVDCLKPRKRLARVATADLGTTPRTLSLPFTTTDGCEAIAIQFSAIPGLSPGLSLDATLNGVALKKAP